MGPLARERIQRIFRHWVAGQPDSAVAAAADMSADSTVNMSFRALATEYQALMVGAQGKLKEQARIYALAQPMGPMGASRHLYSRGNAALQQVTVLGKPAEARAMLDRLVADPEWTSYDPADRTYLDVALAYAVAGAPEKAEGMLKEHDAKARAVGANKSIVLLSRQDSAQIMAVRGLILVAEGKVSLGAGELDAADRLSARSWYADFAGDAFAQLGQPDSAIVR